MRRYIVILAMLGVAAASNETLAPWGANSHPTDAPKRHVEKIAVGRHVYVVRQGGTMDGVNCRSPLGVGMMDGPAIEQTWESNRAVRLENAGETDVINPWLGNGRNGAETAVGLRRADWWPESPDEARGALSKGVLLL